MGALPQYALKRLENIDQVEEGDLVTSFVGSPMSSSPVSGRVIKKFSGMFAYSLTTGYEGFVRGEDIQSLVVFRNDSNSPTILAGPQVYEQLINPSSRPTHPAAVAV